MLANIGSSSSTISVALNTIGITGSVPVKNVWTGTNLGNFTTTFAQTIPSHDAGLYILGNGSTTTNTLVSLTKKTARVTGEEVFFTTGDRFIIPATFAGKIVSVATFDLAGKQLNTFITRDHSIPLYKSTANGEKVGIVKISEFR